MNSLLRVKALERTVELAIHARVATAHLALFAFETLGSFRRGFARLSALRRPTGEWLFVG